MQSRFYLIPLEAMVVFTGHAFATVYLTVEQAQALLFPGAKFQPFTINLTNDQVNKIEDVSGVDVLNHQLRAWRVSTGGWFIADEVVGKHEFIPFAVGLTDSGAVKGVEILEYREAYGGQIRDQNWLQQFIGKQPGVHLRLERDIHNISGATLSCKHVTDGVTRLLATYEIVLRHLGS